MSRLASVPIIFVSLFCGHEAVSAAATETAARLDCLAEMNEVRAAAGLAAFGNATADVQVLPESSSSTKTITPATLWAEICKKMKGDQTEGTEAKKLQGTFAYYPDGKDCKAAVQYWKEGFSLFKNELPPTYTASNTPAVYTDRAVSFVALYNPQPSPLASCALVTCTQAAALAAQDPLKSSGGPSARRLQGEEEEEEDSTTTPTPSTTTSAVICLTNPKALTDGQAPFKEEVWQKIVQAIVSTQKGNGVSPVRPSLAVGFVMMLFAYGLF
ncbi:SAG family member (sag2) [Eimeria tenella]|uniref:SAG family member (Sag2) n=1 Tax=Eimeria tenella TaxID=5802 RepID=Q70CD4_EIMTE|nr:SAG family member (sag2) [Eimeria tenella]CAE52301.1 surface antigen 2 [Eimeria tenella]CDJ41970.1 SAG family member (sag2) [Eimeria tenella]|eukprot:XP_013232720.1 SAG family member (sag2) [Eimeria tenella]